MAKRDGRAGDLKGTARERLLDAALEELAERSYDRISLQAIADRADLTKGAVYWNFADKEALFAALVADRVLAPVGEAIELTRTAPAETATGPAVSEVLARVARSQPALILLMREQWARAVRDPAQRAAYRERQALIRDALAQALSARHETTGVALTYPAARLATAIMALASGLVDELLVADPAVDDTLLGEVLQLLYDGLTARAAVE